MPKLETVPSQTGRQAGKCTLDRKMAQSLNDSWLCLKPALYSFPLGIKDLPAKHLLGGAVDGGKVLVARKSRWSASSPMDLSMRWPITSCDSSNGFESGHSRSNRPNNASRMGSSPNLRHSSSDPHRCIDADCSLIPPDAVHGFVSSHRANG